MNKKTLIWIGPKLNNTCRNQRTTERYNHRDNNTCKIHDKI